MVSMLFSFEAEMMPVFERIFCLKAAGCSTVIAGFWLSLVITDLGACTYELEGWRNL